ncbi:MAG TPA: hypothetical protein VFN74_11650 [Chloroflexota bacterium]|nr:hypothetical protein [Chloroflexota bacterium]
MRRGVNIAVQCERDLIRELAHRVAEIAASPEQAAIQRRWRDVNALRKPDRAPVWCRPVEAWHELLPDDALTCEDRFHRGLERALRHILIKHEIGDDEPVERTWRVAASFTQTPAHTWGVEIRRIEPDEPGGAYHYDSPLKEEADFDRLALPTYTYDPERTRRALERTDETLGDILPVVPGCDAPLSGTLCDTAAALRGQGELMWDLAERPHLVHRLMAHLSEGTVRAQRAREATGLLTLNNHGPMYTSDPPDPAPPPGQVRLSDLWIAANSQDFDQVSPAMWEEFLLAYQRPIFEQFRFVSYGCCENLTRKMDTVLSIPNLRVFVCSAWTDLEKVVEAVGDRYVIMWRQKATDVIFATDLHEIRRQVDEGMRIAAGCRVQIVLRELQTLNGHLDRLKEWATVAKEVAWRYA